MSIKQLPDLDAGPAFVDTTLVPGYDDPGPLTKRTALQLADFVTGKIGTSGGIIYEDGDPRSVGGADAKGSDGQTWRDQTGGIDYGPKADGTWQGCGVYAFASHTGPTIPFPRSDVALGYWLGEHAVTGATGVRALPNELSASPVSLNLIPVPLRNFASSVSGISISNTVVTDLDANGPDGTALNGSRVVGTGTWALAQAAAAWSTGTYTLSLDMKSNTGVSQTVAMGKVGSTVNKTVTTSWQTFTTSFTLTSGDQYYLCTGTVNSDIEICNYRLDVGGSAIATEPLYGHMILGAVPLQATPTVVSNSVHVTAFGQSAPVQFPNAYTTYAAFTAMMVVKITTLNEFHGWLNSMQGGSGQFIVEPVRSPSSSNQHPEMIVGGVSSTFSGGDLYSLYNMGGYHAVTYTSNGTTMTCWIDNVPLYSQAAAAPPVTLGDFFGFQTCQDIDFNAGALWHAELSLDDIHRAYLFFKNRSGGTTIDQVQRVVIANGDSITGSSTLTYVYGRNAALNAMGQPRTVLKDIAVAGVSLHDGIIPQAQAGAWGAIAYKASGQDFVYSVLNTNDIANSYPVYGNYSAWLSANLAHMQDAGALGFIPVEVTITPRADSSFNTTRNVADTAFRAAVGSQLTAVSDFASDGTYGTDAAGFNTMFYPDGTHPTPTVQTAFGTTYWTVTIQTVAP